MMPPDRKRIFFDRLAVVTLVLFSIFVAGVLFGVAAIPRIRAGAVETPDQLRKRGYHLQSTQYSVLAFTPDDARLTYRCVDAFVHDTEPPRRIDRMAEFATGRYTRTGLVPPGGVTLRDTVLEALLTHYQFANEMFFEMAVSRDGRELAFLQRFADGTWGILHRSAAGIYRNVTGGTIPPGLAKLVYAGRKPRPLTDRLSSPQDLEWADAAIEFTLINGARAGLFADRLAAKIQRPGADRDLLVSLLARIGRAEGLDEAGRAIVAAHGDPDLQRQIVDALTQGGIEVISGSDEGITGDAAPIEAWTLLDAMLKRDWGPPDDYLRVWLLRPLKETFLSKLTDAGRLACYRNLQRYLDLSFANLLAPIIEGPADLESAAASWALQSSELAAAGKTPDRMPSATDAAAGRIWFKDLRGRRPDLFRNN